MAEPLTLQSSSARHGLPFLHPAQAQKEAFVNEALARLDALVHSSVVDQRSDPPTAPTIGESYLVGASPSGDWAGETDAIATWQGSHWLFVSPVEGTRIRRLDSGQDTVFSGGWQSASAPPEPAGGATVDAEARQAITALVNSLRQLGIFPTA